MSSEATAIQPNERVTYRVLHRDDDLVIVEKPARVVTHPGVGHEHDTLLNGLWVEFGDRLRQLGVARDWGLVHRLDRDTSGIVAVALSARAYDGMREQFGEREVRKFYWAITHKPPREPEGVIKRPIQEVVRKTGKYTAVKLAKISDAGKPAVTAYRTLAANDLAALVEARPVTGRLHQVRVHMDLIGCAIVGDEHYGPRLARGASARLALHAHRLCIEHPVTGEALDVRSKWPADLKGLLRSMKLPRPDLDEGEQADAS